MQGDKATADTDDVEYVIRRSQKESEDGEPILLLHEVELHDGYQISKASTRGISAREGSYLNLEEMR